MRAELLTFSHEDLKQAAKVLVDTERVKVVPSGLGYEIWSQFVELLDFIKLPVAQQIMLAALALEDEVASEFIVEYWLELHPSEAPGMPMLTVH